MYWWICQPWCHYFWGELFYTINSPTMKSCSGSLKSLKKNKLIPTYIETSINNLLFMLHLFVLAKNHRVTKNLCCLIMKIFWYSNLASKFKRKTRRLWFKGNTSLATFWPSSPANTAISRIFFQCVRNRWKPSTPLAATKGNTRGQPQGLWV